MPHAAIEPTDKANRGAKLNAPGRRKGKAPVTKRDQMIRMLSAPRGAGVDAISKKLGWQVHTTRAALSRLRKAGFEIQQEIPQGGKPGRYRIISSSSPDGRPNAA